MAYGWSNHVPETARTVAKAFYEGRVCKRGNCHTDGETYWLENTAIAKRVRTEDIAANVTHHIMYGNGQPLLQFQIGSWASKMTARHLTALGVPSECFGNKNPRFLMNGMPVQYNKWYSKADIDSYVPPPVAPKCIVPPRDRKFVNVTMELF